MYGTFAAAKNTAPVNTSHGSQCPHGPQTCAEAQSAAKTAASRVHHIFPAMEPAVAPNENPRSTEPLAERLRSQRFRRNHKAKTKQYTKTLHRKRISSAVSKVQTSSSSLRSLNAIEQAAVMDMMTDAINLQGFSVMVTLKNKLKRTPCEQTSGLPILG